MENRGRRSRGKKVVDHHPIAHRPCLYSKYQQVFYGKQERVSFDLLLQPQWLKNTPNSLTFATLPDETFLVTFKHYATLQSLAFTILFLYFSDDDLSVAFFAKSWQSRGHGLPQGLSHLPHERPFGLRHVSAQPGFLAVFGLTALQWRYVQQLLEQL